MYYFAPEFKNTLPQSMSNAGLVAWLREISPDDIHAVAGFWKSLGSEHEHDNPNEYEQYLQPRSIGEVCGFKNATNLIPFLMRQSVTVYCASGNGHNPLYPHEEDERSEFQELAYNVGRNLARSGRSLRTGGGNSGLMGAVKEGFLDEVRNNPVPGQCFIQVVPARFIRKDKSVSSSRAKNEGMGTADVTIIVPSMPCRYLGLSIGVAGVFTLPGGDGSMAEHYGERTLVKIGVHNKPLIGIDYTPQGSNDGYYHHLRRFEDTASHHQLNWKPDPAVNPIHWVSTLEDAMAKLDESTPDPDTAYRQNMAKWRGIAVGEPVVTG